MAHKKGLGSSRNGRDSNPKMLGVKIFSGQEVKAGMILVRQRGTKFRPGAGTGIGRDDTIFATRPGTVAFRQSGERFAKRARGFRHRGQFFWSQVVNVFVERFARMDLVLDAIERGHHHRGEREVRV